MAKIALISESLSPQVQGLARALKHHHHEITIITSHNSDVPKDFPFSTLTFFKKWNALEAVRFFTMTLGQAPEIWHFVYSQAQEPPRAAHWLLAGLARALPGRLVVGSFYENFFHVPRRRMAPFIKLCDIVTTATRESLMYVKRNGWLQNFAETEVLPPFLVSTSTTHEPDEIDFDIQKFAQAASPYVVVPSARLPSFDWDQVTQFVNIAVLGKRPQQPLKALGYQDVPVGIYYVGEHLTHNQKHQLLNGSLGLLGAYDDFSPIELLSLHQWTFRTQKPFIANARQAEALPGLCVPGRNGFLIDQSPDSFTQLLRKNELLSLENPQFHCLQSDLADSALNELNRLYAKGLTLKASRFDRPQAPLS